jgi:hypothetical protein
VIRHVLRDDDLTPDEQALLVRLLAKSEEGK